MWDKCEAANRVAVVAVSCWRRLQSARVQCCVTPAQIDAASKQPHYLWEQRHHRGFVVSDLVETAVS